MNKLDELREGIARQLRQWDIDERCGCPQKDLEGNPSMQTSWAPQPRKVKEHYLGKADKLLHLLASMGLGKFTKLEASDG